MNAAAAATCRTTCPCCHEDIECRDLLVLTGSNAAGERSRLPEAGCLDDVTSGAAAGQPQCCRQQRRKDRVLVLASDAA